MIILQKINLEYKLTALFGCTALVLSFVTGFIAGIRWNYVLIRSLVLAIVFSAIGFGICFVLRKFVPEAYEFLAMRSPAGGETGEAGEVDIDGDVKAEKTGEYPDERMEETAPEAAAAAPPPDEFRELDKEALAHYSTGEPGGSAINTGAGKLGKHVLEKEKLAKYEPKIMAQAVRTMMSRDKE